MFKIPNVVLWGQLGRNFGTKLKVMAAIYRGSVLKFSLPFKWKRKKKSLNFQFLKFQIPKSIFTRTIDENIIQEKFENFRLRFVGGNVFWNFLSLLGLMLKNEKEISKNWQTSLFLKIRIRTGETTNQHVQEIHARGPDIARYTRTDGRWTNFDFMKAKNWWLCWLPKIHTYFWGGWSTKMVQNYTILKLNPFSYMFLSLTW